MILSHAYINILAQQRKSSVEAAKEIKVGDKIMISSDFSKFATLSKYSGSGDTQLPENYEFIASINAGKLSNLFSSSKAKSVFKVSTIENNYPPSGSLDYAIQEDAENMKNPYSTFGQNKRVMNLLNSAIENDPNSTLSRGDKNFDFDRISKNYNEYRSKNVELRESNLVLFKREVYDDVLFYAKLYNISNKYLGV